MGEKIYLKNNSMEQTIDEFLADYRKGDVENMAIVWTNENGEMFKYNFMATQSCFKLLGLLELMQGRVIDYVEVEQTGEGN